MSLFISFSLFIYFILPVMDEMSYCFVLKVFKAPSLIFPAGMYGVSLGFPRRASYSHIVILGISVWPQLPSKTHMSLS